MSKKEEINEEELMAMMAQPFSVDNMSKTTPKKEEPKPKKKPQKTTEKPTPKPKKEGENLSYKELFLTRNNWTARTGKTIYIRQEHHERLSRIISVIGKSELSVSDFVDKLLDYHFVEFETEIKKQFKENYKPIL
ncbi:MAG: DUF3408 domain-containing protein [Flavobacteriaceae bacterium]|nr:DUF3408 domain-containing protein [Flavobacteriaceae bacterium]